MASSKLNLYCASKYALTGFLDSMRQEMTFSHPNIALTNIYPYHVNTEMFVGFTPLMHKFLPMLIKEFVADRVYEAIMFEDQEVYIYWFLPVFKLVDLILPLKLKVYAFHFLISLGMTDFVGRSAKRQ